jgi:hypothetical protein
LALPGSIEPLKSAAPTVITNGSSAGLKRTPVGPLLLP